MSRCDETSQTFENETTAFSCRNRGRSRENHTISVESLNAAPARMSGTPIVTQDNKRFDAKKGIGPNSPTGEAQNQHKKPTSVALRKNTKSVDAAMHKSYFASA
jgi:hypothetical protein